MKIVGKIMSSVFVALIDVVIVVTLIIFGLALYTNIENSRNDLRNYEIGLSLEKGISAEYVMPVGEVLGGAAEDTVMFYLNIIDEAAQLY